MCGRYWIDRSEEIRFIHDRMPLMMPKSRVEEWIQPDVIPEKLLADAVPDVLYEKAG